MRSVVAFRYSRPSVLSGGRALCAHRPRTELNLETGKQIYESACAGCHGQDGKGQPESILGFEPPATFPISAIAVLPRVSLIRIGPR